MCAGFECMCAGLTVGRAWGAGAGAGRAVSECGVCCGGTERCPLALALLLLRHTTGAPAYNSPANDLS